MEFNADYVDQELENIGIRIKKQISLYLIGGVAMSFRELKETTKDIDIVFKNNEDYLIFKEALFGAQYHEPIVMSLSGNSSLKSGQRN